MNHLLKGKSPPCPLEERTILNHLESSSSGLPTTDGSALIESNPVDEECAEWLLRTVGPAEVSKRLLRMSNTAPGPDKVRYNDLKRIDPGCLTLSTIYTRCLRTRKIPKGWKESETILLHKGGSVGDISNWRPLAMGNCVAKLYAAVLADRITVWAKREKQLSPEQKGFLTDEGCLEENFLLQSAIDDCSLAEESQHLTTFITPWGRYKFLRGPMGLMFTGDEYCRRTDAALGHLPAYTESWTTCSPNPMTSTPATATHVTSF